MIEDAMKSRSARFHRHAMQYVDMALEAKRNTEFVLSYAYFRQALRLERDAASYVPAGAASEPTRSVLYRSAAELALSCDDKAEALRLAHEGLTEHTPAEIREELEDVIARANEIQGKAAEDVR